MVQIAHFGSKLSETDSGTTNTCSLFSSGGCNRVLSVPNCVFFFSKNTQLETESTRLHPPLEKRTHKMDKEYMISKSVHHFTRKNTRFKKEYTLTKIGNSREAERQCIVSLYLKYNLADVKKASTSFDSLIENVYVKRISTIIASWKCGVLILLSCQSMPNGLRYATAGLRR